MSSPLQHADLLQRLDSYSEANQQVLQALAVTTCRFNVSNLRSFIRQIGWSGSFITAQWRNQLLSDGMLEMLSGNNFRIAQWVREILCQRAAKMNRYALISKCDGTSRYTAYGRSPLEIRKNRLALYTGDSAAIRVALGTQQKHFETQSSLPECYRGIAKTALDMEWLDTLEDDIKFQFLHQIVHDIIHGYNGFVSLIELRHILEQTPTILSQPEGASLLATIYLWRGDIDRANLLLPHSTEGCILALRGRIAFLSGDDHQALALYQAAIAQTRKERGKRNVVLVDEDQIFYLLVCLRCGKIVLFRKLVKEMTGYHKRQPLMNYPVIVMLSLVMDIRERRMPLDAYQISSTASQYPVIMFFVAMGLHWLGATSKMKAWFLEGVARTGCYAQYHEMDWMAWELNQILEGEGYQSSESTQLLLQGFSRDDIALADSVCQRMESSNICSCLSMLEQPLEWKDKLQALKSLRDDPIAVGASDSGQRMAWLFWLNDQTVEDVEPRIQKLNKNGCWSKGRKVALKRLYNGSERNDDFPFLTEQDRRICDCIREERDYAYYASAMSYFIEGYDALREAAGHPHLFLNNMLSSLSISNEEIVLHVTREDENICINIHPFPDDIERVRPTLLWQGSSEVTVYNFTEEQRYIAKILGKDGLVVPQSAQEEALESIAAIAPLLTVHSAVEGAGQEAAQEVEADSRLHLHLQPAGDGLKINCFVRPFGEAPLLLAPGEGGLTLFTEHEGITLQTRRDLPQEIKRGQDLFNACSYLDADEGWAWALPDPQQALETLDQLQTLSEQEVVLEWPEGKSIALAKKMDIGQFRLSMHKQQDWFELDGEIQVDENQVVGIKNLLMLVKESPGRFIRLGEDQFLSLSNALYQRLDALQSVTDQGRFHGLAAGAIEEITDGMKVRKNKHWQDHLQSLSDAQQYTPELPSTLQAELRDYQQEGFAWLARLTHWGAGACLADDMGLGKTVQALALMLLHAPKGPMLVVAPTSVCMNWESEVARFAPTLKLHSFAGSDRKDIIKHAGAFDVVICSYALLQRDSNLLTSLTWQVVVLDEAQAIKNGLTKRSKAAMALQANVRLITTGTPIENHLGELWNLFQFINPGLLGSLESFNRRFANPIEGDHNKDVAQRLKQLIHPFILRRLKRDVLQELPPRTEITIHVDLSTEEMALYEATRQRAMERIAESADAQAGAKHLKVLAEIMRLRRACCHPSLIMPNSTIAGSKLAAFAECIDELREGNHKALVFSQFVGHLAILRGYLDKKKIPYQYLDGSTPVAQRKQRVDAFQAGEGDLFLISLKAGGSGLNLTAADFVLHMDPWWNPAVEDQASDRAHRIGQTRPVTIYRFIAKHTIEDKIVQLHQQKRDLADSLLEGSDSGGKMSLKDIMRLVEESEEEWD